ncbi:MAG TPA: hypothetical protein VFK43_10385, partial [Acidimicrobiales bacterium]|nr:hypothetical protein [Acidimicrobiales bacterium]
MAADTTFRGDPSARSGPAPVWVVVVRWAAIALVVAFATLVSWRLVEQGNSLFVVLIAFVVMAVVAVYATRRAVPLKYLLPGMLLLVAFQIWPIAYTAATAFTNYGDGHLLSKEDATANIVANSVQEVPGSPRYRLSVAVPEGQDPATGDLTFLLTDPDGKYLEGTAEGLEDLPADGV